ncbi:MAG: acyltransferase [Bacteroidia bacterium]|nr:acyltransferase [Bacteroidia bacterium]
MTRSFEKPNFLNLDALRFFAFLAVFLSHCISYFSYSFPNKYLELLHKHFFINGNLGVNFFFVLSGFLISWLLFIEKEKTGKLDIKAFYMRRILRIWPVYFIVVLIGFSAAAFFNFSSFSQPFFHLTSRINQLFYYVFFLGNFDLIINGPTNFILSVLWSVSIEEQFYLVWPIFFYFLSPKKIRNLCIFLILTSFVYRYFNSDIKSYLSSFSVMSDLAIGGFTAYICLYNQKFIDWISNISKKQIFFIYSALILFVPLHGFSHVFGNQFFSIYYPFEAIIFSFLFAFIIVEQNFGKNSYYKFGNLSLFSKFGKISYGLYSYHMLMFPIAYYCTKSVFFTDNQFFQYLLRILISLSFTIILSKLSYLYFESYFLKFKTRFSKNLPK